MDAYNPDVDDLGLRLKRVREARGLSQTDVARRAMENEQNGPTPKSFSNYLSKVENERETNPSLDFLERAARGMGLTLSELFVQIEGLPGPPVEGTDQRSPDGDSGAVSPETPRPLDDVGALLAANSSAVVQLSRAIDRIGSQILDELRAAREQAPAPRVPKSGRAVRHRKVG